MKVGDLVIMKRHPRGGLLRTGVIVDVVQKKCWRTHELGPRVNFDSIDPEPHGSVLIEDQIFTVPVTDLEVVNENR